MDAITIQILRNKVASLVDEMHYHFYRSGYSTIIRESRDFSCVILDRDGRLIVAPPMFFHAPVYRYLVERILKVYGPTGAINEDGQHRVVGQPLRAGHLRRLALRAEPKHSRAQCAENQIALPVLASEIVFERAISGA